jgi:hypothetical protein
LELTLHILYGQNAALLHSCSNLRHLLESSSHRDFFDATVDALADPPPKRAKATMFHREDAADEDRPQQCRHYDCSTPTRAQGRGVLDLLVVATSTFTNHGYALSSFSFAG